LLGPEIEPGPHREPERGKTMMHEQGKSDNHRVKGSEQFWISGGLEGVLQVRAAYLSQDGRAEEFHERRPRDPAVGRNRAKLLQPTG
jgi:hypothetical protein